MIGVWASLEEASLKTAPARDKAEQRRVN